MAHRLAFEAEFVEVVHTGRVTYADRLAALTDIAANPDIGDQTPVLINFTGATIAVENIYHADYMARAAALPSAESRSWKPSLAGVRLLTEVLWLQLSIA